MDPLTQILLQRATQAPIQSQQVPSQPQGQLPVVPPNVPAKVPPQTKRWMNAQQIQDAYRGNWTPNPILLRASLGRR